MRELRRTPHVEQRVRQRGYKESDAELVLDHGTSSDDGCVLTRKDVDAYEGRVKRQLQRLRRLVGTVVIEQDGKVLSIYRTSKEKRRRLL